MILNPQPLTHFADGSERYLDVEPTRGDVGGKHEGALVVGELGQRSLPILLQLVAGRRGSEFEVLIVWEFRRSGIRGF